MQKLFLTFLAFILFTTAHAQHQPLENSLLWKVSGNGLAQPSYLFGTIHAICPTDYFWTNKMEESFNAAQQLYLELPMADDNFQTEMMQAVILKDSATLRDYFSLQQYEKLSRYLSDSLKMPVESFTKMKPLFLLSLFVISSTGCDGMPDNYEAKIIKKAKAKSFEIKGLETIAQQVKIFDDNMPKDSLAAMIMSYIDAAAEMKKEYNGLVQIYKTQNIEAMYKKIIEHPDMKTFKDVLLNQRNRRWVEQIKPVIQQKPTFFAVGAGHLAGEEGVIDLLRKEGYTVEAVL